jgi:hypothetical protein
MAPSGATLASDAKVNSAIEKRQGSNLGWRDHSVWNGTESIFTLSLGERAG